MLARRRAAWLTLLSVHPALFYLPGERLSLAELGAARLDGHVVEVGEGYMPADTIETSAARALSLSPLMPPATAISGISAAWVHGAGDRPPAIHHFSRTARRRPRIARDRRLIQHDRLHLPEELQMIAGIMVTTPLVTAETLLFDAGTQPSAERWLRALMACEPHLLPQLHAHVSPIPRRPGKRKAERLLEQLMAQEVVTR